MEFREDPTTRELVHLMHKETQTNEEKVKYTIPWLLLSVIAKMKVKESAGSGLDARPSLDMDQGTMFTI